jgi:hypothetical protein
MPTTELEENQYYSWNESIINWEIKTNKKKNKKRKERKWKQQLMGYFQHLSICQN